LKIVNLLKIQKHTAPNIRDCEKKSVNKILL
jgi:hypothetical protein